MKRVSNVLNLGWRRRSLAAVGLTLAAMCTFFVASALGDAGNPILGTIKVSATDNGNGTVTVYVRGQWNWLSHNTDCNVDRAATGVGIIWDDLNGPPGTTSRAVNEKQTVTITGNPTGGTFKLKFNGQTTGSIAYNATAAQVDSALEGLSTVGAGNVNVTGGPGPSAPWSVEFVNDLGGQDVTQIQLASKSFTGGSGPNVTFATTTVGAAAVFNGFLVSKSPVSAYVGTKNATSGAATNPVDQMVHPVDRGNQVEGYRTAGTDYPANQTFFDPSPPSTTATSTWRGGCGRLPLTATAVKGDPFGESTGLTCATGDTSCSGHPWGSWGYEKCSATTGTGPCTASPGTPGVFFGYSHTYLKTLPSNVAGGGSGLPDKVCVNFYDVHTGSNGSYIPKAGDITVDGNSDNSIQTNAFNVNNTSEGGNCVTVKPVTITTAATSGTVGDLIHDTATLSVPANAGGTITFKAYKRSGSTAACDQTPPAFTSNPIPVSGPGDYTSNDFDTGGAGAGAGKYDWIATYSGDAANFVLGAATTCGDTGETSTVDRHLTNVPTAQTVVVTDFARVSAPAGAPTGTVTFKLFKEPSTNCTTNPIYTSGPTTLTADPSGGKFSTANTTANPFTLPGNGTYSWLVTYTPADNSFASSSSSCGTEQTTVSGNSPGITP